MCFDPSGRLFKVVINKFYFLDLIFFRRSKQMIEVVILRLLKVYSISDQTKVLYARLISAFYISLNIKLRVLASSTELMLIVMNESDFK